MDTSEKNQGTHDTDSADPIEETQGASQGDEGGKGCEPMAVQEDPDIAADKADSGDKKEKDGRRRKAPVIILLILALLLACAGGFMLWKSMQPDIDPGATATQIINKSIFPVHVTKMAVAQQDPFHIVDDVTTSKGTNDVQFTVHGAKAAASVDLSADTTWNMGYAGSSTDHIDLETTDAKIARVTVDLSTPQKAATITWTLASGNAQ